MVTAAFVSIVDFCRRRALLVTLLGVALGVLAGVYAATHIAFDTNTAKLIDSRVPWRQLGLGGVRRADAKLEDCERPFVAIAEVAESVLAGQPRPLSWQYLFTGRAPAKMELRRFILTQPVLDYTQLSPGQAAQDAVRAAA